MTAHAAVSVDDDFPARQSGVTHRTADYETSGGIDVILRILVEQLWWDYSLNDVLQNAGAQLVVAHRFGMLRGNHHRIHS